METVIGIFPTRQAALEAAQELRSAGIAEAQLTLMEPQSSLAETSTVNPPKPEAPGACGANAENVQGAILGFAGGLLGSTILVLALPGIGPIAAVGALGLSGAVGSLAGGVFGQAAHNATATEITLPEFLTYESALQHEKHLLIVQPNGEMGKQRISRVLSGHGAEDFDLAHEHWWESIRTSEMEEFGGSREEFTRVERAYRKGFEAAIAAYSRPSSDSSTVGPTQTQDNTRPQDEVFERGYARGQQYYEAMLRQYTRKEEQSVKSA